MKNKNIYILSFAIGLFLIAGIVIAGDLLSSSTTKDIPLKNLNTLKTATNITVIKPTISDAVCINGTCKISVYQKDLINDFIIIQEDTPEVMRATADAWVVNRLTQYAESLEQTKTQKIINTSGELTINGR